jgi:hypothetical protein
MRRRKLLVVLAALAALVAAGMVVLWPLGDRISLANYERIREGMTLAEVEAILGQPGDYTTGPADGLGVYLCGGSEPVVRLNADRVLYFWVGDTAMIYIVIDAGTGTVLRSFDPVDRVPQPTLDNLLWRAKRLRHRWFP